MRNQTRRGDAMEHEELRTAEHVEDQTASTDLDTDDSDASDALEVIGREAEVDAEPRETAPVTLKTSPGASPFLLESLYFRSFGERALLTRDEEIALAKRLDEGSRRIRTALRDTLKVMARAKRTPIIVESTKALQLARGLSGFSATALDKVERAIVNVLKPVSKEMKPAAAIAKQLKALDRREYVVAILSRLLHDERSRRERNHADTHAARLLFHECTSRSLCRSKAIRPHVRPRRIAVPAARCSTALVRRTRRHGAALDRGHLHRR